MAATKQSLRAHGMMVRDPISMDKLEADIASAPLSLVCAAGAPGILETLQGCHEFISGSIR